MINFKPIFHSKNSFSIMPNKKQEIIEAVVDFIKSQDFSNIKADMPGYATPQKLVWSSTGSGYTPDITAVKDNTLLLFVVKDPNEDAQKQVEKWRLFSSYTSGENRICYIVSMTHQEFTVKNILEENQIKARVLTVAA